jgi:cytochrome c553
MINNHFPTVFAALVVLAALTAPANAAEQIAPTGEREFGAKMLVCNTCHGAKGVPQNPTIPVIS